MSARIQQARISDEYVAGDVQSHQNRANEEIEYQRWINAQALLENNALKKLLINLLRAVDAAKVRIPQSHLVAVKRDLILLKSMTVNARSAPSAVHESQRLGEQAKLAKEFVKGSISEQSGHESVPQHVREYVPTTKPQPDRSIKRNIQAYGPAAPKIRDVRPHISVTQKLQIRDVPTRLRADV